MITLFLYVVRGDRTIALAVCPGQVLSIIVEFCSHQESLVIRAMAEVTTQR